jgi:hypothetical protein
MAFSDVKSDPIFTNMLSVLGMLTLLLISTHRVEAKGIIEMNGGSNTMLGGTLPQDWGGGATLSLGWGGKLNRASSTSLYGYCILGYDRLYAHGEGALEDAKLTREHTYLGLEVRPFMKISRRLRLSLQLGIGNTLERATLILPGLADFMLSSNTTTYTLGGGLLYVIKKQLALTLSYSVYFFHDTRALNLIERPLLVGPKDAPWGRSRISTGLAYLF